jgi:hypothetical protein
MPRELDELLLKGVSYLVYMMVLTFVDKLRLLFEHHVLGLAIQHASVQRVDLNFYYSSQQNLIPIYHRT